MLIKCENKVWKVTFQLDKDNYIVVWDTPCSVKYIYIFLSHITIYSFTLIFFIISEKFQINLDVSIPEIQLFQNLILKIEVQGHGFKGKVI